MKTRPLLIALGLGLLALPSIHAEELSAAQKAEHAFLSATRAEAAGNAAAAKQGYEAALQLNPRHANARYRLGQLRLNYERVKSKGREKAFSAVVIPEFRVDQADFSEALQALAKLTDKASKSEVTPNFIIQDPSNVLATRKVTLQMKSTPAGGILNYLLEMAKAKARYDEHAIVILPR